ncbi:peroxisomal membrane protein [Pseudomassariella vexata]|uniref:Peroxisomal membrane protein PEX16 n=1 Tax=Pseudomassariella vexata TaxID=1141098 RepID=A0A1Y2E7T2_9PEZI|nr:peroxisomal membrane protein [Pseudomassariella vexata]ORY67497.1 peroxisomal membrane protein [Pseudomassariella vexata]
MSSSSDHLKNASRASNGHSYSSSNQHKNNNPIQSVLSLPPRWLHMYSDFITKNAHQVSQIESALRSLTYIIPGRFRDAEIASETLHSGVQLLSLYHDAVLLRALSRIPGLSARVPSLHARYTRFWTEKSRLYRRTALLLQVVQYTELLWEMTAKRRGEKVRWRIVIVLEAVKALCRLLLLRITNSRPLVTPVLPEREPIPDHEDDADNGRTLKELMGEDIEDDTLTGMNGSAKAAHEKEWTMPRTGTSLPSLPNPNNINSYLQSRVLTADDIKPAVKLLNTLQGSAQAAEILHILAPLIYVTALARSKNKKSWTPWVLGVAVEYAARQLRERSFRTTGLEREEWGKRGWTMGWWTMRGAFYENVTKSMVGSVKRRMPSLVSGILEDYEYLWENYYFSTSA